MSDHSAASGFDDLNFRVSQRVIEYRASNPPKADKYRESGIKSEKEYRRQAASDQKPVGRINITILKNYPKFFLKSYKKPIDNPALSRL